MRRLLFVVRVGLQMLTGAITAVFLAADALQVGGAPTDWELLALIAFIGFVILTGTEQYRLHSALSIRQRTLDTIARLTTLSTEGSRLAQHPGAQPGIWIIGGPETEHDRKQRRDRSDYEGLRSDWCHKVRNVLEDRAPEFLADWEATDPDKRFERLLDIIKEIRSRLVVPAS